MDEAKQNVIELTADIVSAYAGNNSLAASELPGLIQAVHTALTGVASGTGEVAPAERPQPAVPLRRAVQPDFVVDLFTGKKFKSLKRHLRTVHNMTPEQYREFWGLPKDSPMVAPNYAAARSELAKSMGLGQGGRKAAAAKTPRSRKAS